MEEYSSEFLHLPNEIISNILLFCSVEDLCKLSRTCRKLRDAVRSEYLWYQKWTELVKKSGLSFPHLLCTTDSIDDSSCNKDHSFRNRCHRLWSISYHASQNCSMLPSCIHCGHKTCTNDCLDTWERKVAMDIGSKTTWLLTTTFALQRHPSVLIISDSKHNTRKKDLSFCNSCSGYKQKQQLCLLCSRERSDLPCKRRHSYPLHQGTPPREKENCFLNSSDSKSLPKFNTVTSHSPSSSQVSDSHGINLDGIKHKETDNFAELKEDDDGDEGKCSIANSCLWLDLKTFFKELHLNCKVVSPVDCFLGDSEFFILEQYIYHILERFNMLEEVRKPNVSFVFCEPFNSASLFRKQVARFLFEELKISRICFLNKALSTAALIGLETCLVIDSGASSTVVTLIIDGEVQTERTRYCPVGGTEITRYLGEAIKCSGIMENVSVPSLDTSHVKSYCYLSYNIAVEERRRTAVKHRIFVTCRSPKTHCGKSKLEKLELGSELFLAPEVMYTAMHLPETVLEVMNGLDVIHVKEALRHILLTGGNTELNGFATRLIRDLQVVLPDYSRIINVHTYAGSRSWDSVMGSTRIPVPLQCFPYSLSSAHLPGSVMWVTREDYIVHGPNLFENQCLEN